MEPTPPRIEIFAPFGEAFELMRKILFRPFDIGKWLVIGFAAWLATFFSGIGFSYRTNFRNQDWHWHFARTGEAIRIEHAPIWVIPLLVAAVLVGLAVAALLLWLNSRARFIFTDCIVRNRAAIVQPWKEFRSEGDRYFVLQIVISFCSLLIVGGLALVFFAGKYTDNTLLPLAIIILLAVCFGLAAVVVAAIMHLMIPVMYRQRCSATSAFSQVWRLIVSHPAIFILFALFYVVIYVAGAMISCLLSCVTCCVAALPYIGTVILLPVVLVLYAFPLCFMRQFGEPYDAWATIRSEEPPPLPEAPPVQLPPPPPPPSP